ncbi:MAG: ubiquitin-like domain-containing protein [Bacillota bacterium]
MEEFKKLAAIGSSKGKMVLFLLLSILLLSAVLLSSGKFVFLMEMEGEEQEKYFTFSRTVEEFILETGVQLKPQDRLLPPAEKELRDGDVVLIRRAIPVILYVDGEEQECWTHARQVMEFLRENGINIGEGDRITPGLTYALQPGDRVEVTRGNVEYVRQREAIPYNTLRIGNTALDRGIVKVKQDGEDGEKELLIAVVEREDGEISRTVLSQSVLKEPVPRILEYGENTVYARGGRTFEFAHAIYVSATAYCPGTPGSGCPLDRRGNAYCTGIFNDGYTFTGTKAVAGEGSLENPHIIAVDPAVIPLYSLVYLEGYGFAHALDRGGAIQGLRIDLLFDKHEDALAFGRRQVKVYIFPR